MRPFHTPASFLAALLAAAALLLTTETRADLVISELMAASQSVIADENGMFPDWIELHNTGTTPVDLAGWHLTDNPANLTEWEFPAGISLAPNAFLIVFASGEDRRVAGQPLHTGFALDSSGEFAALVEPDGTTIASSITFPIQFSNLSYGLGQELEVQALVSNSSPVRVLIPTSGTLGLSWTSPPFNHSSWTAGINGVGYESSVPGFAVRNFRANTTVSSLATAENVINSPSLQISVQSANTPTINYLNTLDPGHYGGDTTFPGLTINSDADDFVTEAAATLTIPTAGAWTFGVNSDDGFGLVINGQTVACDCLRGPSDTLATLILPAGKSSLRLVFFERGGGAEVELFAAQGSHTSWNATSFRLVGDTANGGLAVESSPLGATGYTPLINTDVRQPMLNQHPGAYIRLPFNVPSPASLTSLTLRMQYDDGFVAYLNGVEAARGNAPASPQYNSTASASRNDALAVVFEHFDLTPFLWRIGTGANVLAIHGLNRSSDSSDFLVAAELGEYRVTGTAEHYFGTPTPGSFNSGDFADRVAQPAFSHQRGFYNNPFTLRLTNLTAGATVRYTLDGSAPSPSNGFTYSSPLTISGTTTLQAAAFLSPLDPSPAVTHTYIFTADVLTQSPSGQAPGPGWPAPRTSGGQIYDYGMDPGIINDPAWGPQIEEALKSIPSFSLVMNLDDLFDPGFGIYSNPGQDGLAWERPGSIELIHPDGSQGFGENCGVRIRGGFSRSPDNPKHSFRLFFRSQYGVTRLQFPVFGPGGASEFDKFDLRTAQNYSWSFGGDSRGIFFRDQFSRDTQLAMNGTGERGGFHHLYINGHYWGLFNTAERPEAAHGESYFGGEEENYDVVKVEAGPYTINATDGNLDAWTRLWEAANAGFASDTACQRVQGNNADGSRNPAYEVLLDPLNLIDYMLIILYGGNLDAPISEFLGNTAPNNWYGLRERSGNFGGFKFMAHDSEHTLLDLNADRTGPYPAGNPLTGGGLPKSNPQYIWQQLQANAEFRIAVADRAYKHLFNQGALAPGPALARFQSRSNEIQLATIAESARWGDAKRGTPLTRNDWLNAANSVHSFIAGRTTVLLNQLRADGLYPTLNPPAFLPNGGSVPFGLELVISNPAGLGTIYYTLDGSDPRQRGGTIHPSAQAHQEPLILNQSRHIRARILNGGQWTALVEATFYVLQDYTPLRVTELMYNPPGDGVIDGDEFEFLELKNAGNNLLDLTGLFFSDGITFTFSNNTLLPPGQIFLLARNPDALATRNPGVAVHAQYSGRFDNSGEQVAISHLLGGKVLEFTYSDKAPWPIAPDNFGFSLVPVHLDPGLDLDNGRNWRASTSTGGNPGSADPGTSHPQVVINEILTHTDPPETDSIELLNLSNSEAGIGGWFLTDDPSNPKKFRIPDGTTIAPHGHHLFTESDFNPTPASINNFSLSSTGDEVYLLSGNAASELTGYSHGFRFEAAANGASFGRYLTSTGEEHLPAQSATTPGTTNSGPRIGPVVINEIHYNPLNNAPEFVELHNVTSQAVPLYDPAFTTNRWRISGLDFTFNSGTLIQPFSYIVLTATNPALFRSLHSVPAQIPVLGPCPGRLQDSGERLTLERPDSPNPDGFVPYIAVDGVRYNDKTPWPAAADGSGPSLQRLNPGHYGDDPINWFASGSSPGTTNVFNAPPTALITQPSPGTTFVPPASILLRALASDPDGSITQVEFLASGVSLGIDTSPPYSVIWTNATPGTHSLTLMATDNNLAVTFSEPVEITVFTPIPVSLIPRRSDWKYLDTGADLGTGWRTTAFNDSTWPGGPAPLGYGDGDEATLVGFGTDPNAKYITTYYRRQFNLANAAHYLSLALDILRDDGVVIYLNGTEIHRNNMPPGTITHLTPASSAVGGGEETSIYLHSDADPGLLVDGINTVAVEIHQASGTSSDTSFDLELSGTLGPLEPGVTILSPQPGALFAAPATVPITARATAASGSSIATVDFYSGTTRLGEDTTPPYTYDWTGAPLGDYILTAVAQSSGGLITTSAPVTVHLVANTPPTIALTQPAEASAWNNPGPILLAAEAADIDGAVTQVRFLIDGANAGSSTSPPHSFTWLNPAQGIHALAAAATDNHGATRTSTVVRVAITAFPATPTLLINPGSVWSYLDNGSDLGTAWRALAFDDTGWAAGAAELGYGDGPEVTTLGFGPDPNAKFPTSYFRRRFNISNAIDFAGLQLRVLRDDGVVVHLNQTEIFRNNLPSGEITANTTALTAIGGADESTFIASTAPASPLLEGENILAVEIHQAAPDSSDISFDLELAGERVPHDLDSDGLPNGWELVHGLDPHSPADATGDADGDGLSNEEEYRLGTDPNDAGSGLRVSIDRDAALVNIRFDAAAGVSYLLQNAAQIEGPWLTAASFGSAPTNRVLLLTRPASGPRRYFRVRAD